MLYKSQLSEINLVSSEGQSTVTVKKKKKNYLLTIFLAFPCDAFIYYLALPNCLVRILYQHHFLMFCSLTFLSTAQDYMWPIHDLYIIKFTSVQVHSLDLRTQPFFMLIAHLWTFRNSEKCDISHLFFFFHTMLSWSIYHALYCLVFCTAVASWPSIIISVSSIFLSSSYGLTLKLLNLMPFHHYNFNHCKTFTKFSFFPLHK